MYWQQSHGWLRLTDACGERSLTCVVRSNRRPNLAQIAEEVNAGSNKKVSVNTVHHSLLRMGLHSRRPFSVPMLTPVNNGHVSIRTGPRRNGRRWLGLMNHVFFNITWMAGCRCIAYLANTWHQDAPWEEGNPAEAVRCLGQCSAGKPWVLPSIWMLL